MKNLLPLLFCCAVLAITAPVSANEDVSADDFTNALVDYCNGNIVHNMTDFDFELSNHEFRAYDVIKKNKSLDFKFECKGKFFEFICFMRYDYKFGGEMHIDKLDNGEKIYPWEKPPLGVRRPYSLEIYEHNYDRGFIATGPNWVLKVRDYQWTEFY